MDKLLQNIRYEISYDRCMKTFEEKNKVYHMEAMESIKEENMGIAKTRCRHRASKSNCIFKEKLLEHLIIYKYIYN